MTSLIDLHTHILPEMDDGSPNINTSVQMLTAELRQGVKTVALTPHFYRNKEHIPDFLKRRDTAFGKLVNQLKSSHVCHPQMILSAEVAYAPGIADWEDLELLCYNGTNILLIEPPMTPWNDEMFRQLYALEVRRGITPMIAHLDRYWRIQPKDRIEQLLETGFPLQISTASLMRFGERSKAMKLITHYGAIPVSDCHNMSTRPPDMEAAIRLLTKKLGEKTEEILQYANSIRQ